MTVEILCVTVGSVIAMVIIAFQEQGKKKTRPLKDYMATDEAEKLAAYFSNKVVVVKGICCDYCRGTVLTHERKCPNCGANNANFTFPKMPKDRTDYTLNAFSLKPKPPVSIIINN